MLAPDAHAWPQVLHGSSLDANYYTADEPCKIICLQFYYFSVIYIIPTYIIYVLSIIVVFHPN